MTKFKIQSHSFNLFTITIDGKRKLYKGYKLSELPNYFATTTKWGWENNDDTEFDVKWSKRWGSQVSNVKIGINDIPILKDSDLPDFWFKHKGLTLLPYKKQKTTMVTTSYEGMTIY